MYACELHINIVKICFLYWHAFIAFSFSVKGDPIIPQYSGTQNHFASAFAALHSESVLLLHANWIYQLYESLIIIAGELMHVLLLAGTLVLPSSSFCSFSLVKMHFMSLAFLCCDNLKHFLWYAEAPESDRICECEAEWRLSIYEWPLTAGERWTAGFSLLLFLRLLSPSPTASQCVPSYCAQHSGLVWKSADG